ncbi:MAG: BON domain-containing protein [Gammaproteobacteria bacterium]|nr:BON domain-containing protein [Gammaproteobacteria bacterium]
MEVQMKHLKEIASSIAMGCLLAAPLTATAGDFQGDMKDAWLDGKIETTYTLNQHLNPLAIKTEVRNRTAYLSGTVESDIDRDLAAELALAVEGVKKVENNIKVKSKSKDKKALLSLTVKSDSKDASSKNADRSFAQIVNDATTTAAIKSKFAVSSNVSAMDINIDTRNNVVTLSGTVDSEEEKDLAGAIAMNASTSEKVRNELRVRSDS